MKQTALLIFAALVLIATFGAGCWKAYEDGRLDEVKTLQMLGYCK